MPASRAGAFPFLQAATGHRLQVETATEPARTVQTTYDYDAANNRKHKTVGGVTATCNYNTLNQLTGWTDTAGKSASYTYDSSGNRTTRTVGTLTDSYGYDVDNRLVRLTKNTAGGTTGSYAYVYDHRTRRVSRTEGSVTTKIVFSGGTSVQEYTAAGALTVDYVRGSDWGGGVGGILYSMRSNAPSFAHYNRRGDVTARTDGTGAITYQASYEAGGTRTREFGATQERQKANTKEEDPTGLLNEGMRFRDLEAGCFITQDPTGFVDGPNLYAYVRQNPWSAFDPEGLFEWKDVGRHLMNTGAGVLNYGNDLVGSAWEILSLGTNGTYSSDRFTQKTLGMVAGTVSWGINDLGSAMRGTVDGVIHGNFEQAFDQGMSAFGKTHEEQVANLITLAVTEGAGKYLKGAPELMEAPAQAMRQQGHRATMTVLDSEGNAIHVEDLVSGGTGKAKPTFPEQGAVHTEAKGTAKVREMINGGADVGGVLIEGVLPPCKMCKGSMNQLQRETGVPTTYVDGKGETWESSNGKRPPEESR